MCMAMSVSAWEVQDLQAACGGSVHACARGRREHPAWGGDDGTVRRAASRARTAGGWQRGSGHRMPYPTSKPNASTCVHQSHKISHPKIAPATVGGASRFALTHYCARKW